MFKLLLLSFFFLLTLGDDFVLVVGVHDGDSITVLSDDKVQTKIRLTGIDAPELGQAFGKKAKQVLSDKCFNKKVKIQSVGIDRYGRTVAWVYTIDNECINVYMVKAGCAWHYKQFSKDITLATAEVEARHSKLNIWSDSNFIPPWEFRKIKKQK